MSLKLELKCLRASTGVTVMAVYVEASKHQGAEGGIRFNAVNELGNSLFEGCKATSPGSYPFNSCTDYVPGMMNFSGFDRLLPNYKACVGGRGITYKETVRTLPYVFEGQFTQLEQNMMVGAE